MSIQSLAAKARPNRKVSRSLPAAVQRDKKRLDAHLDTFCDRNSADIFRSVAYPTEIWTSDPVDVESIHEESRQRLQGLLTSIVRQKSSSHTSPQGVGKIQLILGEAGSGKTHLMRSLRTMIHGSGDGFFGYMQMTSLAGNYGRYVLQKLVDSLDKPYEVSSDTQGRTTGLLRLSTAVAESCPEVKLQLEQLRMDDLAIGEPVQLALAMTDKIIENPLYREIEADLITAIVLLQSGQYAVAKRVIKYLRADKLNAHDQCHLAGLAAIDEPHAAIEMIVQLGQLVWASTKSGLVICVDQLEDIFYSSADQHDPQARFRAAATTLVQIASRLPNSIIVIACLEMLYDSVRAELPGPLLDRIENESPEIIVLKANRSQVEIRELITKHLGHLYKNRKEGSIKVRGLYPIPVSMLDNLTGKRTRDVLRDLRVFRESCMIAGMVPESSTVPNIEQPVNEEPISPSHDYDRLDLIWNDFRVSSVNAPPDEDEKLAEILNFAISGLANESLEPHSFRSAQGRCDLLVQVRKDNLPRSIVIGRVCNRGLAGNSLGLQLEGLIRSRREDNDTGLPSIAALIRNTDCKPKTSKTKFSKTLEEHLSSGGRLVIVPDSEWRTMIGLRSFQTMHSQDPLLKDWLRTRRPLSQLASLRHLLGLDGEVEDAVSVIEDPADVVFEQLDQMIGNVEQDSVASEKPETLQPISETIDATSAEEGSDEFAGKLVIGRRRNREAVDVSIDAQQLKRHLGVLGSSGSGKTTAALNLIEQLTCQGVPVLMIDRKGDLANYARINTELSSGDNPELTARRSNFLERCDVAVYTPGQPEGRAIAIPIAPDGMKSMKDIDRQMMAKQAANSLGQMLGYKERGKDASRTAVLNQAIDLLGQQSDARITLSTLIDYLTERDETLLESIGTIDKKIIDQLLESLQTLKINRKLLFTDEAEPLSAERLFGFEQRKSESDAKTRLSIISLQFLADNDDSLFWVSQLLLELSRWMSKSPSSSLQAVVMFDEADLYLPATKKPPTKEPMENLLKRARSAGLGIMLATQSPGDLDYKCRDNIDTWLLGKIAEENAIKKMKGLLDECPRDVRSELPSQTVGEFFLVSDGEVTALKSNESFVRTTQLSHDVILELAAQNRPSGG